MANETDELPTTSEYVSSGDHKPLGVIVAGICVLIFIGVLAAPTAQAPQTELNSIAKPQQKITQLSVEDENRVCRAAVATIMGHDPAIMKSSNTYGTGRTVTYRRPSDGRKWTSRCSVYGDTVNVQGLMTPVSGYTEELEFTLGENAVTIFHYISESDGARNLVDRVTHKI